MAIDTTPSTVATSALQAIPFESLIGGPLDACIKAQAIAAKTSWDFINEVGLTVDPITGEKKAINVTFDYNNNGQMTTLVVPLIILLPIPYLAIDKVTIDFIANISAAASSVTETSSNTDISAGATIGGTIGWGPFQMNISANANYSSKQASKASQNSSYSVEYTMNVHVEGGQADMPAGLATVLNILQGSVTAISPNNSLVVTPPNLNFNQTQTASLQVVVKDSHGVLAPGVTVTLADNNSDIDNFNLTNSSSTLPPTPTTDLARRPPRLSPFKNIRITGGTDYLQFKNDMAQGRVHPRVARAYSWYNQSASTPKLHVKPVPFRPKTTTMLDDPGSSGSNSTIATAVTDQNGLVAFQLALTSQAYNSSSVLQGQLTISASVPVAGVTPPQSNLETQTIVYSIFPVATSAISIDASPTTSLSFTSTQTSQVVTITVEGDNSSSPTVGAIIATVSYSGDTGGPFTNISSVPTNVTGTTPSPTTETAAVSSGTVAFTFALGTNPTSGTGTITFQAADSTGGQLLTIPSVSVDFTITTSS